MEKKKKRACKVLVSRASECDTERTYIFRQISLQVHVGDCPHSTRLQALSTYSVGPAAVVSVEAEYQSLYVGIVHVTCSCMYCVINVLPPTGYLFLAVDLTADPSRDCPLLKSATWRDPEIPALGTIHV